MHSIAPVVSSTTKIGEPGRAAQPISASCPWYGTVLNDVAPAVAERMTEKEAVSS
jgi:hypothetical protein